MSQVSPDSLSPRSVANGRALPTGPASAGGTAITALAGEPITADICVIGAGAGGLAVAAAAAAFGRKVVLVEKHKMGGDNLNFGCVPTKALLASAKRAQALRTAAPFGIASVDPQIDYRAVHQHIKGAMAAVAPNDSVERYTGLGVRVILGAARFVDKRTVMAGDYRITARRIVIATGSSPIVPPLPGLDQCPFYTSETIVENDRKIPHLIVIGAGPVGLELAQAHHRLGSRVTVLEAAYALGNDDPEATQVVLKTLRAEGIEIHEGAKVERVENVSGSVRAHVATQAGTEFVDGSHLLIAVGRRPNLSDLNLDAAGIKHGREGIAVNRGLRTSNSRVYAIGDVIGGPQYTHVSDYHAGIVLRRALFWASAKADPSIISWATFTDPELAQAGPTEAQARAAKHKINVLRWPFVENDRAQTDRETIGHVKVITTAKGRILGATIVGARAGELIQIWALAVSQRLNIEAMTGYVTASPTLGEASKRAAQRYYATTPAKPSVRKLIDFLARLG